MGHPPFLSNRFAWQSPLGVGRRVRFESRAHFGEHMHHAVSTGGNLGVLGNQAAGCFFFKRTPHPKSQNGMISTFSCFPLLAITCLFPEFFAGCLGWTSRTPGIRNQRQVSEFAIRFGKCLPRPPGCWFVSKSGNLPTGLKVVAVFAWKLMR